MVGWILGLAPASASVLDGSWKRTQLQRSVKLKIAHWFYWSLSSALKVFIFCQQIHRFATLLLLTSQPFNEMFIFSGKSPCCITALLLTSFYIAANKECITKRLIILRSVDSAFPLLYCLKFSFKSVEIVLSVMQENDRVFFWSTVWVSVVVA